MKKSISTQSTPSVVCFLLVTLLMTYADDASALRQISDKRECAVCHIMWLSAFNQNKIEPLVEYEPLPVVETGKQDVASTERMCFSCHDGFVEDSRESWMGQHMGHPVGMKPSDKVTIPTIKGKTVFPMNNDGNMYCGTCHTAHGVEWSSIDSAFFLRMKNVNSSLCIACHLQKSTGVDGGNHPVFNTLSKPPQQLLNAGAKFGLGNKLICQTCHRAHGGPEKFLLTSKNDNAQLCAQCHVKQASIIDSKHHIKDLAHGDQTSGPCNTCHGIHQNKPSAAPPLWIRPLETSDDPISAACLECHSENGLAKSKTTGTHSHPLANSQQLDQLLRQNETPAANGQTASLKLPRFDEHGKKSAHGKQTCATCHDPHVWTVQVDQTKKTNDDGDGNSSFLRIPQAQTSNLCLHCHQNKTAILDSKHNPKFVEQLEIRGNKKQLQQQLIQIDGHGVCSTCHNIHNAAASFLRNDRGAESFEQLCKNCHEPKGTAAEKTLSHFNHPLDKPLGEQHNSAELPLYNTQGEPDQHAGHMSCPTCHDVHQWQQQHHQLNSQDITEGDGGNSFLRLPSAHDSELCISCHQQQKAVIGSDHDMSNSSPMQGNTVDQAGVCAICHAIHNSLVEINLWGRNLGEGNDIKEQMCRDCHAQGKLAETKIPKHLHHPKEVVIWSSDIREQAIQQVVPDTHVFDPQGHTGDVGNISCPSCHDPHVWQASNNQAGTGQAVEGDVLNSFLRIENSENLVCADCHGIDGLFRYKFFHQDSSRTIHPLYQ